MSELRKCNVHRPHQDPVPGLFHGLGQKVEYDDGGQAHSVTVANVELIDGPRNIIQVPPPAVSFTD